MTGAHIVSTIWNTRRKRQLVGLWDERPMLSTQQIAERMKINRNQVLGKAHRLNLPARSNASSIGKEFRGPRRQSVVVVAEATGPGGGRASEVPPIPATAPVMPRADWPAQPKAQGPPRCCWPLWGYRDRPTHRYCGQPIEPGRRYCEAHNDLAFIKVGPRLAA